MSFNKEQETLQAFNSLSLKVIPLQIHLMMSRLRTYHLA